MPAPGFLIPGGPLTPSDSRAHGPVSTFKKGDDFYEQVLAISSAEAEIVAMREQYNNNYVKPNVMTAHVKLQSSQGLTDGTMGRSRQSFVPNVVHPNFFGTKGIAVVSGQGGNGDQNPISKQELEEKLANLKASLFCVIEDHVDTLRLSNANIYRSSGRAGSPSHVGLLSDTRYGVPLNGFGAAQVPAPRDACFLKAERKPQRQHETGSRQFGSSQQPTEQEQAVAKARGESKLFQLQRLSITQDYYFAWFNSLNPSDRIQEEQRITNLLPSLIIAERKGTDRDSPLRVYRIEPDVPSMLPAVTDLDGPFADHQELLGRNVNVLFNATAETPNGFIDKTYHEEASNFAIESALGGPAGSIQTTLIALAHQLNHPSHLESHHSRTLSNSTDDFFSGDKVTGHLRPHIMSKPPPHYAGYSVSGSNTRETGCQSNPSSIMQAAPTRSRFFDAASRQSSPGPVSNAAFDGGNRSFTLQARPSSVGYPGI
ncbi:MAG: hypothetical protein M1818_000120 [Claussenomyces sp. TS43310]|nr:MAG: hypothetical protein M1818_000120 [Claussenomyces sp. TS43310]